MWKDHANNFANKWHFPHCYGAIDGKHVLITAPPNSGCEYFHYKGTFSIVLMAIVDAEYRFVVVEVGGYGRQSDGGTFGQRILGQYITNSTIALPKPDYLPGTTQEAPSVFVADDTFPLEIPIVKPFGGENMPRC